MKNQKIIKICKQKLIYLNYSERTINCYIGYICKFLEYVGERQVIHLSAKDFQLYLDNMEFSSVSQQNQIINAIRFLYKFGLNKKYDKVNFTRPKKEKKLPQVIESNHLISTINKIKNIKHKAIISLGFSCGLRVSEVINLKIEDIDSKRMLISIKNTKGKKDRYVPLSEKLLLTLREYYKEFKPTEYLFNGQSSLKYSSTSCNKIVKKYFGEKYHFHQLRHSSFTTMLENGTDISIIQKIAGHSNPKTTLIYAHISNKLLSTVKMPL